MNNTFILNPDLSELEIKNAIYERLYKAQSVTACVLASDGSLTELTRDDMYSTFWALDGYLDEIETLCDRLERLDYNK